MTKKIFFLLPISLLLQGSSLKEQNKILFDQIKAVHKPTPAQIKKLEEIFKQGPFIGQGNPKVTKHPMTPEQCQAKLKDKGIQHENKSFEKICGGKYMAPLFNPDKEKPEQAKACIDQFEFPNIPCSYPVVWVRAREAQQICAALDKRMCDAHEWEGGCSGELTEPDYFFDLAKGKSDNAAFNAMRSAHNRKHKVSKKWAYGKGGYKKGICAANSIKSKGCNGGDWHKCGSNTYPTGAFPECSSRLKVYDIHGNAAEHMNLPTKPEEMTSKGSTTLGLTEMKGSWFIWDKFQAHQDWCRWRCPYWHGSRVMYKKSHHNYHLGFRCCKSLK